METATSPVTLSAAERTARGRERLAAARGDLAMAREQLQDAEGKIAADRAEVERFARAADAAEARARDAEDAVRMAAADCGVVAGSADEAAAAARLTDAEAEAATRRGEREAAIRQASTARRQAQGRAPQHAHAAAAAEARVGEVEATIAALEELIARDHGRAGEEQVERLRGRSADLRAAREQGYRMAEDAEHEMRDLERELPAVLADWPDLAGRPVAELVPARLSAERAVLEAWRHFLQALEAHSGTNAAGVLTLVELLTDDRDKLRQVWSSAGYARPRLAPIYGLIEQALARFP